MRIVIANSSPLPIYEQIKEQVKAAILSGELAEGEALPSIRALARDLRISVITTTRAYADLAREGFVANIQGKGSYVLPVNTGLVREQLLRTVEEAMTAAVTAAHPAGLTPTELHDLLDHLLADTTQEDAP